MTALRLDPSTPTVATATPTTTPAVRARPARVRWPGGEYAEAGTDPGVIGYRLSSGSHRQLGLLVEVSVEDYQAGGIRRHEAVQPDRVRGLVDHLRTAGVEDVPITLLHRGSGPEKILQPALASDPPTMGRTDDVGTTHEAWVRRDPAHLRAIQDWLDRLGPLYIADGHHRMAAADRYADLDGAQRPAYTLAVLFPSSQTRILGYHRRVALHDGLPDRLPDARALDGCAERLARQPAVEHVEETALATAPEPGVVVGYAAGRWYRLWLRPPLDPADPRGALDVVRLDDGVLGSLLGAEEASRRVTPVAGDGDIATLAAECDERGEAGFFLHPPTVDQVLAVADAGQVLPPKSTWFAPKVPGGLFRRPLNGES